MQIKTIFHSELMKIVINTSCLTSGGGQKVAWNFVNHLQTHPSDQYEFFYFCAENSAVHQLLTERKASKVWAVPGQNALSRIRWELLHSRKILARIQPDVIYSIFGYPFFPRKYCSVIGEADSNLFFPEVRFWTDFSGMPLLKRKMIDQFRKFMMRHADGIIFENSAMEKRCHALFHISRDRTCFIKPSIHKSTAGTAAMTSSQSSDIALLLLCGWQPNKNIMIMPRVLKELLRRGLNPRLFFTVKENETGKIASGFYREVEVNQVKDNLVYSGHVPPDKLPELYEKADQVLLLSRLESFSNNIIEAWKFSRPLIVSDLEWSHAIIGDAAACYVDRDSVRSIADGIQKVHESRELRNTLVENGLKQLSSYPDIGEHVRQVLRFLEKIRTLRGKTHETNL